MTLAVREQEFNTQQLELIKRTVAAGTTDDEFALFIEVARTTGLNPFQRQIYAIKRKSGNTEKMTIQTGIDGYRLIAARTGAHLGTTDPEFGPIKDGYPEWARVVVRRIVQGQVAEFPVTARWSEYVQTKDEWRNNQRTGNKIVGDMWAKMPHTMLGKCAEALALRKAFPAELSGVYTAEEMQQADTPTVTIEESGQVPQGVTLHTNKGMAEVMQRIRTEIRRLWNEISKSEAADKLTGMGQKYPNWRTDDQQAADLRVDLICIQEGIPHDDQPAQDAPVVELVTAEQLQQLQAAARTAGATTSADRAMFWGSFLPARKGSVSTKELTGEEGAYILEQLAGLDVDGRKQAFEEAKNEAAGRLV